MSSSDEDDSGAYLAGACDMGDLGDEEFDEPSSEKALVAAAIGQPGASGVTVNTLAGSTTAALAAAVETSASPVVDKKLVTVYYSLAASPNDLASGRVDPVLSLPAATKGVFDDASNTGERSRDHVVYSAKVVSISNGFPFALGIDLTGHDGTGTAVGKCVVDSGDGKCVAANRVVNAGQQVTFPDGARVYAGNGHLADKQSFVSMFPGYNLQNIASGIQKFAEYTGDSGSKCLVPYGHPVTAYFNEVRRAEGASELSESDFAPGTRMFVADSDDTETCLDDLRASLSKNTVDLHDLGFTIKRVIGNIANDRDSPEFTDTEELKTTFASNAMTTAALSQTKRLVVGVEYEYRHS